MKAPDGPAVYGPVPSRRLGYSLGVDLVPFKTCSYDCIYCQLGRTPRTTVARKEYVPLKKIVRDLDRALSRPFPLDTVTLSGSGEPTLYSRIPELMTAIRRRTDKPVTLITNGSLLGDPAVREAAGMADRVLPSLDAGTPDLFRLVNRPHPSLTFDRMVQGLIDFRKEYSGSLWLEVFLLDGVTAMEKEARRIGELVRQIGPDRVQLNTVARPPAEEFAYAVSASVMGSLQPLFPPPVEVIASFSGGEIPGAARDADNGVLELLKRRPCTLEDIAGGLNMHRHEALKSLERCMARGKVETAMNRGTLFYRIKRS